MGSEMGMDRMIEAALTMIGVAYRNKEITEEERIKRLRSLLVLLVKEARDS